MALAIGCGGSQGTEPHDMSAAQHESAAGAEEAAAEGHAEQYDTEATSTTTRCAAERGVCWTSTSNPTQKHEQDAAKHREHAEQHRAASKALRDAEAQACAGIDEADSDVSPFYHREDIASVSAIEHGVGSEGKRGDAKAGALAGGRAVFRAVPGLTAEWLQRQVDCHRARAAAMGFNMSGMEYCPLMLKDVAAKVTSTGDGFAVDVTSSDAEVAKEVVRRMQAAKAP
jgi:hypothetical protein